MPKRLAVGTSLGLFTRSAKRSAPGRKRAAVADPVRRACLDVLENRTLMSATYFVATWGADNAAGTLAQPFRTIQEAANVAYSGDTVAIEGGTYHETVTPPHSGVTFTNYNNQNVVVSGADQVSGFSNYSGNIYDVSLGSNLGEGNNQVFVDGQLLNEARFPNTNLNPSSPTKATIGSYSNNTIYDSSLTQGNGYWVGANINITPGDAWATYTGTVTASGPGWITVSLPSTGDAEQPQAGNSYFLYGKLQALDTAGEFYVDSNNTLYLWDQSGDNPNNHDVEVKTREYGFDLSGVGNTTIQGINLFACGVHTSGASTGTTLNAITDSYATQYMDVPNGWWPTGPGGIELYGAGSTLENSTIAYSAGDGVFVSADNVTVNNNTIHDVDYSGTDAAGIRSYGNNDTFSNNTIYNAGRDGINFRGSGESILSNTIHDVMLLTTDGGAIYTVNDNGGGSVIAYNSIYNINCNGLDGVGIYLDNYSSNFVVHDNVTSNVQAGVKFNFNSNNQTVYNNQLGANKYAIESNGWTGFAYDWSGTQFYDNTYYNPNLEYGANVSQWGNVFASGSPAIPASTTTSVAAPNYTISPPPPTPPAPTTPASPIPTPPPTVPSTVPSVPTSPASPASPPPAAAGASATSEWNATAYAQSNNVGTNYNAVGNTYNGSWVEYNGVDFGTGVGTLNANVAVAAQYAGQKVEVFVDSLNNAPIATLTVANTGAWNNFQWQSANVGTNVTGMHSVYIEFVGNSGIANLANWNFSGSYNGSTTGTPGTTPASTTGAPAGSAPVSDAYPANSDWQATLDWLSNNVATSYGAVGYTYNGSWIEYGGVHFGNGLSTFNANVAVPAQYAGQKIEVFLDSLNSNPVATLTVQNTGAWNNFQWQNTSLVSPASGVHNVYIEFVGSSGISNLMSWQFS